ncbi:MAG: hypothetical protein QOF14_2298 [Hyphomicrobiales bacterium]|jgi:hypothetical protein|nr:hypothetical protein [Hyphomicrobiales bacterium]
MADRFSAFPLLFALVLAGLSLGLGYSTFNFEQFDGLWLLTSLLIVLVFFVGLVLLVIRLARRQWRRGASVALALALIVAYGFAGQELFFQIDQVRFQVFKDHYVGVLTSGTQPSAGEPTAFRWGFWAHFTTGPIYRMLIHDPADDIQSVKIKALLETKIENFSFCHLSTRRLEGRFYSVVAAC